MNSKKIYAFNEKTTVDNDSNGINRLSVERSYI